MVFGVGGSYVSGWVGGCSSVVKDAGYLFLAELPRCPKLCEWILVERSGGGNVNAINGEMSSKTLYIKRGKRAKLCLRQQKKKRKWKKRR